MIEVVLAELTAEHEQRFAGQLEVWDHAAGTSWRSSTM